MRRSAPEDESPNGIDPELVMSACESRSIAMFYSVRISKSPPWEMVRGSSLGVGMNGPVS